MSVQHAGSIIRQARLNAGLPRNNYPMSAVSTLSLSRIENGSAGVSPATFQTLMAHAGIFCEAYPTFSTRADFELLLRLEGSTLLSGFLATHARLPVIGSH